MRRHGTDEYVPGHGDASFDVEHYDLVLDYKIAGNRLSGEAVLRCRALEDVTRIELDLHALKVARVQVDGASAKYTHRSDRLAVTLGRTVEQGDGFEVAVRYSGTPKQLRSRRLGEAGWEELEDGVLVAAQPHGSPSWFPCNDRPDNKATYDIALTTAKGYHVAVAGELADRNTRGQSTTWTYRQDDPMATYLATVQIGRYEVIEQEGGPVPVRVVAPVDRPREGFEAAFGLQPQMLGFYAELFGDYPFASYTAVITDDDLEIPLESQGLSTFGRNFMRDDWECIRLVAHELSHQWWGNSVTLTHWRDIWLHEGFACYSEWLWSERIGLMTVGERAEVHHERVRTDDGDELLLGDPGPDLMFDDRVYKRGALTLHALRCRIGDHAFFEVLQTWTAAMRHANVTTEMFIEHAERVTGLQLRDLFERWLYAVELPPLPV
ncbi:M1 family metallopeptidase [Janibacter anophelis]|uniref:M1 family metallopeptidase n=1 Tax=Janibacter anophelis TaxID=319054 RepID=UPI001F0773A8|nr:M1 family metallopeptidase [Janibacter anophelis]